MKTTKAFRLQEVRQSHTARVYGRDNVKAREVFDCQMTGRQRRDLFISYIAALERHELKMPRLEPFYREHKYCSVDALYGNGHPPDTVVACALAYHAFRTGRAPGDYGITI